MSGTSLRLLKTRIALTLAALVIAFTIGTAVRPTTTGASSETVCTFLESAMAYADRAAVTAQLNGLRDEAAKWGKLSLLLQGVYLDFDCKGGSAA